MDTRKLGLATAKAMDEIERFVESGDVPVDAKVGAVCIVVALDHDTPDDAEDREQLRDVATQVFCFCVPDEVYIQMGLLHMAEENYGSPDG